MSAPKIRYHLNVQAALIVTAVGLATALGLYVLWGHQEKRVLEFAMKQIKALQETGDKAKDQEEKVHNHDLALRHLTRYLGYRPNDLEGLEIEAKLRWEVKDFTGAASAYEHLIRAEEQHGGPRGREHEPTGRRVRDARLRLAEIYIIISDFYKTPGNTKLTPVEAGKYYRYHVAELHAYNLLGYNLLQEIDEKAEAEKKKNEAKLPKEQAKIENAEIDERAKAKTKEAMAKLPIEEAKAHWLYAMALEDQIVPGQTTSEREVRVVVQGEKARESWKVTLEDGAILEYENALALMDERALALMDEKARNERLQGDIVAAMRLVGLYQNVSKKTTDITKQLENLLEMHPKGNRPNNKETFVALLRAHPTAKRLGDLYEGKRKNTDIAQKVLDRLLDVRDSVEVRIARYAFFSQINDLKAAAAELEQAILLDPENLKLILAAAETTMRSGAGTREAHFWLDQVPRSLRDDPGVLTVQGMVEYAEQKYAAALATWRKGWVQSKFSDRGLAQQLALFLFDLGKDEEAAEVVAHYRRLVTMLRVEPKTDPVFRFLEGIQDEHAGRFSRAIANLEAARDRLSENLKARYYLTLARCQEKQGDFAGAVKTCRLALGVDPRALALRQFLGRLLLATKPEEAAREFEQGLEYSPNQPTFLVSLAGARLAEQERFPQGRRNWANFEAVYERARAVVPSDIALILLNAERLAVDAQVGKAIEFLEDEVAKLRENIAKFREDGAKDPKSPERKSELEEQEGRLAVAASRLADYLRGQGRVEQALEVLNQAADPGAAGDRGSLRVQRALVLTSQGQGHEARRVLIRNVNEIPEADRDEVWTHLFLLCRSQGDPETTRALYNEWARLLPDDLRPKFALLEMDIDANDQNAIRDRLKSLQPHDDQGDFMFRLVQARQRLIEAKQLKQLTDVLKQPEEKRKELLKLAEEKRKELLKLAEEKLTEVLKQAEEKLTEVLKQPEEKLTEVLKQPEEKRKELLKLAEEKRKELLKQAEEKLTEVLKQPEEKRKELLLKLAEEKRKELLKQADTLVDSVLHDFKIATVALLLKGQILEDDAPEMAAGFYNQAWARGNVDALGRLVNMWTGLGRKAELDRLRQNDKTKQLDQIVATAYLGRGDKSEAVKLARQSLAANPGRPSWQVGILENLGKNEEAEAGLRTLTEQQSDQLEPWLALIRFHATRYRAQASTDSDRRHKVEMILEEIEPLLKNRWPDELLAAECRFAAADWPAADQAFDRALKRYPQRPDVQAAEARYRDRALKEGLDAAEECLSRLKAEAYIAKFKPFLKAGWPDELLAAECHFAAADWAAADRALETALKRYPQLPEVQAAEARFRMQKGRPDAAEACLRHLEAEATIAAEIKPHLKNRWPDDLLAAECRFAAADWPAADQAFETVLKRYPQLPEVQAAATRYQTQKERPDAAEACLKRLKIEATIAEAKQRVKLRWPELIEAECRQAAADWPAADQAFEAAVKRYPDVREVQSVAARYYEQRERPAVAEACLRRLLDRNPDEPGAARELAIVLSGQGACKLALELLGPEGSKPNIPEERLARAIVLGRSGDLPSVIKAIDILQALMGDIAAESPMAYTAREMLIQFLLAAGQADQASKLASVAAARGRNPAAIARYAETLLRSRQLDAAEEQMKRLEQIEPANPLIANFLARLILGRSKPAEAAAALEKGYFDLAKENSAQAEQFGREAFLRILRLGPDAQGVAEELGNRLAERNPALSWMKASIMASRGKRAEALALCRTAVEAATDPTDLHETCRIAGEVVVGRHETTELKQADDILETALRHIPEADDLLVMKAMIAHFQSRFDEESRLYRDVLSRKPHYPLALNNLAWLLSEGLHQPSEGLEKIDEVIQLSGRNANNVDTRGVILVRLGRFDQAIVELKSVVQAEPTAVHYYHLAHAYRKMGRDADFHKAFEEAKRAGLTAEALDPTEGADFQDMLKL